MFGNKCSIGNGLYLPDVIASNVRKFERLLEVNDSSSKRTERSGNKTLAIDSWTIYQCPNISSEKVLTSTHWDGKAMKKRVGAHKKGIFEHQGIV